MCGCTEPPDTVTIAKNGQKRYMPPPQSFAPFVVESYSVSDRFAFFSSK
jgi:hypothetical protein